MSRHAFPPAEVLVSTGPATPAEAQFHEEQTEVARLEHQMMISATALADRLAYEGPLTLGGAEDHARMQMRRTVSECLELGKTLLIIKELTAHGEFENRVELLGMSHTAAKRFMQATLKFSKGATSHLLAAAGNQSKLLELLVLDDDEIKELGESGSTRGIELDDITRMSVKELRAALRKTRNDVAADLEAKDRFIAGQSENLQKLHKRVAEAERRQANFTDTEKRDYECAPLHNTINDAMLALAQMEVEVARLTSQVGGELVRAECEHALAMIAQRAIEISETYRMPLDKDLLLGDYEALELRAAGLKPEALQ